MALRGRDSDELRRVYREHVDAVYSFFAYSVARPVVEDLTASTFERVVRSWRSYDPQLGSERTWILTIARNLLSDHYRRQSHRQSVSMDEKPQLAERLIEHERGFDRVLDGDALRTWLAPLADREREILVLRYAVDLPATEVAALLGLTAANVHQIASRALRRLREGAEADALASSRRP